VSTEIGEIAGVSVARYAGPADDAVIYQGTRTRIRYQITDTAGDSSFLTLDPLQIDGLRKLLARIDRAPEPNPLADYRPVYLSDGGVTDEAAILDRILFLLIDLLNRR